MSSDLLKEMLWSSKELHTSLERDLLQLEKNGNDKNLIDTIYRSFHSLKGAAGLVGLPLFEIVTHEGEALLSIYRNNPEAIRPEGIELLIQGCDLVKQLITNLNKNGNEGAVDISNYVIEISAHSEMILADAAGTETTSKKAKKESPEIQADTDAHLHSTVNQSDSSPASKTLEPVSAQPLEQSAPVSPQTSAISYDTLPAMPQQSAIKPAATHEPTTDKPAARLTPGPAKKVKSERFEAGSAGGAAHTTRGGDASVRVSIDLLDRLMNQVGELVLARNQVLQSISAVEDPTLQATTRVLDQVTSELQESVMQTRMQPIGVIIDKFPRIVRDLSRQLGKEIELEIDGRETELDRTVVEAVRDPFTHILRNSIDHGLELPDDRRAAGKPATGTISIRAFHESGQVIVEVIDDGKGIDVDRVKAKAIERGLITEEQAECMSDSEAVNLICHPGLSTAEAITNISGRGVGMDVVRSNIEKIGGSLDLQSVRGQGTTVRIKIPLTLAIIPALMVGIDDRMFGIPQVNLIELVGISAEEAEQAIEEVRGAKVFRLRERLLTVVHLHEILGIERNTVNEPCAAMQYVVVVAAGDHHFGLIVEDIFDTEEIVVKPLSKHLSTIEQFAGATIRGDGSVSLILDIAGIARAVDMKVSSSEQFDRLGHGNDDSHETILEDDFLVFNLTEHDQYAVPLQLVSRIEQYPVSALTRINGKPAISSGGSILPAIMMNELLQTDEPHFDDLETVYAIIVSSGSGVGFIARSLVDITAIKPESIIENADFNIDELASGAAVIENTPTILLDVFKLVDRLFPSERKASVKAHKIEDHKPKVLFAEDAPFFQGVVANYLKEAGYETKVCQDGQEAFDQLTGITADHYDLILTDLEMPRMNGWELIESLRQNDEFRTIPIIALTSLTDEESRKRALHCGATDYRVKLNRDELLEAMSQALN